MATAAPNTSPRSRRSRSRALEEWSIRLLIMAGALMAFAHLGRSQEASDAIDPITPFEEPKWEPIAQAGAGVHLSKRGGFTGLFRVKVGVKKKEPAKDPNDPLANSPTQVSDQLVIAQVDGDFSVTPSMYAVNDPKWVPYMDIRVVPLGAYTELTDAMDKLRVFADIQVVPGKVKRDLNLDQMINVSVSLVGIAFDINKPLYADKAFFFAKAAADAIGYKGLSYFSDEKNFHGVHIARLGAEAGFLFQTGKSFAIRVAVGAEADINWWGKRLQSDLETYAAIRADITRFLQIWVKGSLNGGWDNKRAQEFLSAPELMGGVTFIFN